MKITDEMRSAFERTISIGSEVTGLNKEVENPDEVIEAVLRAAGIEELEKDRARLEFLIEREGIVGIDCEVLFNDAEDNTAAVYGETPREAIDNAMKTSKEGRE